MKFKEYDKAKTLVEKDGYLVDVVTYETKKFELF